MPAFVTRGVVLDMTAVTGQIRFPAGTPFNKKEIDDALTKQGIQIKKVTWSSSTPAGRIWRARMRRHSRPASRDWARRVQSIWSRRGRGHRCRSVGSRGRALREGRGSFRGPPDPAPRNGVYILENINTAPLVADRAWESCRARPLAHHRCRSGDHKSCGYSVAGASCRSVYGTLSVRRRASDLAVVSGERVPASDASRCRKLVGRQLRAPWPPAPRSRYPFIE